MLRNLQRPKPSVGQPEEEMMTVACIRCGSHINIPADVQKADLQKVASLVRSNQRKAAIQHLRDLQGPRGRRAKQKGSGFFLSLSVLSPRSLNKHRQCNAADVLILPRDRVYFFGDLNSL